MIDRAREAVSETRGTPPGQAHDQRHVRETARGRVHVTQAWSGDIVGAQFYLPRGTGDEVLGYWYPDDNKGLIGNDTMVIPTTAQNPRLAHEFLNFFLDEKWGYENFVN